MSRMELGIIGAGNMAEAIARGLLRSALFAADQIIVSDVTSARRELFQSQLHVRVTQDNGEVVRDCRRLLLSVKPQMMAKVLEGLGSAMRPDTLIISIAAGISTSFIAGALGGGHRWRVVRAMPNTPMLVGAGISAICPGSNATTEDLADVRKMFQSAGAVIETTEDKMDAVTAVSGSGPAYFFYLTEQLIAAAVELGIPPIEARELAARTALGAAKMLIEDPATPAELRRKVTSPGGTTEAAITHLDKCGWAAAMIDAVKAAAARSKELSR